MLMRSLFSILSRISVRWGADDRTNLQTFLLSTHPDSRVFLFSYFFRIPNGVSAIFLTFEQVRAVARLGLLVFLKFICISSYDLQSKKDHLLLSSSWLATWPRLLLDKSFL
ncbi:hypothetical protein K1719_037312 [Acacia pycnantha]|nr:hypothetical protein K1719_037312 [Acacia pycnantha]